MNTDPIPFVPEAPVPEGATLKVLFRSEEPGDRNLILQCWDMAWEQSLDCRGMSRSRYKSMFQNLVVGGYGVLQAEDTKVLVGCSPEDRGWIWSFCVFTPAHGDADPVIHWLNTRPTLRGENGEKRNIRRHGLATRMLGMGGDLGPGVKTRMTYTCRPGPLTAHAVTSDIVKAKGRVTTATNATDRMEAEAMLRYLEDEREARMVRDLEGLEADLLVAGRKMGVVASFMPLARWMSR